MKLTTIESDSWEAFCPKCHTSHSQSYPPKFNEDFECMYCSYTDKLGYALYRKHILVRLACGECNGDVTGYAPDGSYDRQNWHCKECGAMAKNTVAPPVRT